MLVATAIRPTCVVC